MSGNISDEMIDSIRIIGNVYFVGTNDYSSSSHLIDTGEGLILIDSGYPHLMDKMLSNIENLGFSCNDIKYLIISHGHYDHLGSSVLLRERYNTKIFISKEDALIANGTLPLSWAEELGFEYNLPFEPDVFFKDGDVVKLGNTQIHCYSTPGHTKGTMSFVFQTEDNGEIYTCATFGGAGINSMEKWFLDKYGLSYDCRDDFRNSLLKMSKLKVDVFLGNHPFNNHTREKVKMLKEGKTSDNPFINKNEWQEFLKECEHKLDMLYQK